MQQQPGSTTPTTTAAEEGNSPVSAATFRSTDPPRLLRLQSVLARLGISKSKLYQMIRAGTFPKQVHLPGGKSVRWLESSVSEWTTNTVLSARLDGERGMAARVADHLLGDPGELLGNLLEPDSPLLEKLVRDDAALLSRLRDVSNAATTTPAPIIRKPQILVEIVRFETELRLSPSEKKAARARFGISGKIGKKRLAILTAYHESLHAELSAPQD